MFKIRTDQQAAMLSLTLMHTHTHKQYCLFFSLCNELITSAIKQNVMTVFYIYHTCSSANNTPR